MDSHAPPLPTAPGANAADPWRAMLPALASSLCDTFGFQRDSLANQCALLASLLASRAAARYHHLPVVEAASAAIWSVHQEYIVGPNSAYARWVSDPVIAATVFRSHDTDADHDPAQKHLARLATSASESASFTSLSHVLLWLAIWGEAANLRFCPEWLSFIFHCALCKWELANNPGDGSRTEFLEAIVVPAYSILRDAVFKKAEAAPRHRSDSVPLGATAASDGQVPRLRDHEDTLGYDDWNDGFGDGKWLASIVASENRRLLELPPGDWYDALQTVDWRRFARKTFLERRSLLHLLVNFRRVWMLHAWTFMTLLPPVVLNAFLPPSAATADDLVPGTSYSAAGLGFVIWGFGGLACALIHACSCIIESSHVPRTRWHAAKATAGALALAAVNILLPGLAAAVGFGFFPRPLTRVVRTFTGLLQLALSFYTGYYLVFRWSSHPGKRAPFFSLPARTTSAKRLSRSLWMLIFAFKLVFGYLWIIAPLGEPLRIATQRSCHTNGPLSDGPQVYAAAGVFLCRAYGGFTAASILLLSYTFWHLDMFLWWTIASTVCGFARAIVDGNSLMRPWQGIFSRLPERILSKIVTTTEHGPESAPLGRHSLPIPDILAVGTVWNRIVVGMYHQYLLSRDQVMSMLFYRGSSNSAATVLRVDEFPDPPATSSSSSSSQDRHASAEQLSHMTLVASREALVYPSYFGAQEDRSALVEHSEANRRLRFFARSLSMSGMPPPLPVRALPIMTVLIPHFAETVLLSTHELFRAGGVMQLKYLQSIAPEDWTRFMTASAEFSDMSGVPVHQTQDPAHQVTFPPHSWSASPSLPPTLSSPSLLALGSAVGGGAPQSTWVYSPPPPPSVSSGSGASSGTAAVPLQDAMLHLLGFRTAHPTAVQRVRKWASARTQTLWRTVHGVMQYQCALQHLGSLEAPATARQTAEMWIPRDLEYESGDLERLLSPAAIASTMDVAEGTIPSHPKVKVTLAMQQYAQMSAAEHADVDELSREFSCSGLGFAWIEAVSDAALDRRSYYSVFAAKDDPFAIDLPAASGSCSDDGVALTRPPAGTRICYRIKLPGPPILGDGKSDNQNTSLIYQRGDIVHLLDANQDNYFEEALKVRSVMSHMTRSAVASEELNTCPLVILGTREHIFSESQGLIGNIAAGKEYVFGTLTQRVMALLNSRLHYGHPDYLNFTFMQTRGGVSKAQRGLHLNEDVFAGMTALSRGGDIGHAEYIQVGKGRDLGFSSVLTFTAKIGAGMAEQIISRDHYHLGTRLPVDWLLTFYYTHTGFHVTNILSVMAIQLFVVVTMLLAVYLPSDEGVFCTTPANRSLMCSSTNKHDRELLLAWIQQGLLAFVVYFISYLPFFLQLVSEFGLAHAVLRLGRQIACLAPVFECVVTQVYATSLLTNLRVKAAKYLATGRRLATSRASFSTLWADYHRTVIEPGLCMTATLVAVALQLPAMPPLAFIAFITLSLIIAPFLFNPRQFAWPELVADFAATMRWLLLARVAAMPGKPKKQHQQQQGTRGWARDVEVPRHRLVTGYSGGFEVSLWTRLLAVGQAWARVALYVWPLSSLVPVPCASTADLRFGGALPVPVLSVLALSLVPAMVSTALHLSALVWVVVWGSVLRQPAMARAAAPVVHAVTALSVWLTWLALIAAVAFSPAAAVLAVMVAVQLQRALSTTVYALVRQDPPDARNVTAAWWSGQPMAPSGGFSAAGALGWVWIRETVVAALAHGPERAIDVCVVLVVHALVLVPIALPHWDHWHTRHMLLWSCPQCDAKKATTQSSTASSAPKSSGAYDPDAPIRQRGSDWAARLILVIITVLVWVTLLLPVIAQSWISAKQRNWVVGILGCSR